MKRPDRKAKAAPGHPAVLPKPKPQPLPDWLDSTPFVAWPCRLLVESGVQLKMHRCRLRGYPVTELRRKST